MTLTEAQAWVNELNAAVADNKISRRDAWEEVFAEMECGEHDAETETFFYDFTRKT